MIRYLKVDEPPDSHVLGVKRSISKYNITQKEEFINIMNEYPIFKSNEMGVMNIILHFKYNIWVPFPEKTTHGKFLFDWCELNRPGTTWNQYCFIKYYSQYNEDIFS